MYICGTCGRQHTSAQEGGACFEQSTRQPQFPSEAGSPPARATVRKKKTAPAPRNSRPEKPQEKLQLRLQEGISRYFRGDYPRTFAETSWSG